MGIFERFRILWVGFWSNLLGSAERNNQEMVHQGIINKQQQQINKLREAVTQLIFQRKRLEARLNEVHRQEKRLQQDLQQAAMEDRDELGVQLMQEIQNLMNEKGFLVGQITKLKGELETAKQSETEMQRQLIKTRQQLQTLASRNRVLRIRKELRTQLQTAQNSLTSSSSSLRSINDEVLKLEAEAESMDAEEQPWQKELCQMRDSRQDEINQAKFLQLKSELKGRMLTGKTLAVPVH